MSTVVQHFLEFSSQIKLYHWQTYVFARHKASDSLFEDMNKLIDKFVEIHMGKYGRPILKGKTNSLSLDNLSEEKIVLYLKSMIEYLRDKLPTLLDKKDTDLLNIRDEMMGLINNTIYLFTLS